MTDHSKIGPTLPSSARGIGNSIIVDKLNGNQVANAQAVWARNLEWQHCTTVKINLGPNNKPICNAQHCSHISVLRYYKAYAAPMPIAVAHHRTMSRPPFGWIDLLTRCT